MTQNLRKCCKWVRQKWSSDTGRRVAPADAAAGSAITDMVVVDKYFSVR